MGSDDELHLRMTVEVRDEQVLIGRPGAACHQRALIAALEAFHQGQFLGLSADVQHPVEAGVTDNRRMGHANAPQQPYGLLVLHEQVGEAFQHLFIITSVPTEEHLSRTEDGRHAVRRDLTAPQLAQIILPELVLDEERHAGTGQVHETPDVTRCVKRQVTHHVGSLVILPYLVARRREERQQQLILRMQPTDFLHQRTPLLELAQRGGVEPQVAGGRVHLLPQDSEGLLFAFHHRRYLLAEECGQPDRTHIQIDEEIVHHHSAIISTPRWRGASAVWSLPGPTRTRCRTSAGPCPRPPRSDGRRS